MLTIRKSEERGHADHGWLDSYHSFSFAQYYDPAHMNYSVLRVINEDVIAPGGGFGMHPHRDMEIITYMLSGELAHKDSLGNGSKIKRGDVQRMSAGTGIVHSEFNASVQEAYLLQIWLLPERNGIAPGYEEKHFSEESKHNRWCLIASPDRADGSLLIHQNVKLLATVLDAGKNLSYSLTEARTAYLQIAQGSLHVNGKKVNAGDAVMIDSETQIEILADTDAEILLFDLPVTKH